MKCFFSNQAKKDLEEIADFISEDSKPRALNFVRKLEQKCKEICFAPEGYSLSPSFGENIRKVPFNRYIIFYTINGENIVILHITRASRSRENIKLILQN